MKLKALSFLYGFMFLGLLISEIVADDADVPVGACERRLPNGKEWNVHCLEISAECFVTRNNTPTCYCKVYWMIYDAERQECRAQTCQDELWNGKTWEVNCLESAAKCVMENRGATCECIDKEAIYNAISSQCKVETCQDKHWNGKTWEVHCSEISANCIMENRRPTCQCIDKEASYISINGECKVGGCNSRLPNGKEWNVHCMEISARCSISIDNTPTCHCNEYWRLYDTERQECRIQTCQDEHWNGMTWEVHCSEISANCIMEDRRPTCECIEKEASYNFVNRECKVETCQDEHWNEKTWEVHCSEISAKCVMEDRSPTCECFEKEASYNFIIGECEVGACNRRLPSGKQWNVHCLEISARCFISKDDTPSCYCNDKRMMYDAKRQECRETNDADSEASIAEQIVAKPREKKVKYFEVQALKSMF